MTILITGSRGKTALQLTHLLAPTHPILVASRSPTQDPPHPTVRFNWKDPSTFSLPFTHPEAQQSPITAIYLVGTEDKNGANDVINFIQIAREHGVKRFVLLSAWEVPPGAQLMGRAHAEMQKLGEEGEIEWAVIRPHFFMENFIESYHKKSIAAEGKIYTAAQDARKPFISAKDIAAVAYRALTDEKPHNRDYIITGGESLSYDEVAIILSEVLGKKVEHVRISRDEFERFLIKDVDFDSGMATYMADLDVKTAGGLGAEPTDNVERVTGRLPRTFREFAIENKDVWS